MMPIQTRDPASIPEGMPVDPKTTSEEPTRFTGTPQLSQYDSTHIDGFSYIKSPEPIASADSDSCLGNPPTRKLSILSTLSSKTVPNESHGLQSVHLGENLPVLHFFGGSVDGSIPTLVPLASTPVTISPRTPIPYRDILALTRPNLPEPPPRPSKAKTFFMRLIRC